MLRCRLFGLIGLVGLISIQGFAQSLQSLKEVVVESRRALRDIGTMQTPLDSAQLRQLPGISMAEVLALGSSLYVKSSGRASLATVAFRGTSASHTQVTWNGLRLNSPMLGMTDFSTLPAFFVDRATILHGSTSLNDVGGGLGGLVKLSTAPDEARRGLSGEYMQGIGSWNTFDEFAKLNYSTEHWQTSTRAAYSSSPNNFPYLNKDKKENVYDEKGNIISQYHPLERNNSAAYKDFNLMQELHWHSGYNRISLAAWYANLNREIPMLTVSYGSGRKIENRQREHNLRTVLAWQHQHGKWGLLLRGGYVNSDLQYDNKRLLSENRWSALVEARARVTTFFLSGETSWHLRRNLFVGASVEANRHDVSSENNPMKLPTATGYRKARLELAAVASARWQPLKDVGVSAVVRQDVYGSLVAPLTPALFADWEVVKGLTIKGSASRNYRAPTLNDLYFLPGGNKNLRPEQGYTCDLGFAFNRRIGAGWQMSFSANWFDSHISDWILWVPVAQGYFTPRNAKKVHSYGVESQAALHCILRRNLQVSLNGSVAWTPSLNVAEKISPADKSQGYQLPYVPLLTASVRLNVSLTAWQFSYNWLHYSRRATMTGSEQFSSNYLPAYFISNLSLGRDWRLRGIDLCLKATVNNLFDNANQTILARPAPGRHYVATIGLRY